MPVWIAGNTAPESLGAGNIRSGRVALVGDAAFIPRPHTAASTSKAAANAIGLGEAIAAHPDDLDGALAAWEPDQLALGGRLEAHGQMLGNRS